MLVRRVDAGVRVACGFCFVFGTGPHPQAHLLVRVGVGGVCRDRDARRGPSGRVAQVVRARP